jgi:hypothetical protein
MSDDPASQTEPVAAKPVVVRVIETFVSSVAATEGYSEVAARLGDTLLKKGSRSEAALKAALFGSDEP